MSRQKKDHLIVLKLSNMAEQQQEADEEEETEEEVDPGELFFFNLKKFK